MIEIKDKSLCCGCSACAQICPKSSIKMVEDEEGFLYPVVDQHTCIECGACEKVCIEHGRFEKKRPMLAYASKNKNEKVRMSSSSGGIFTPLAEYVIAKGGVVLVLNLMISSSAYMTIRRILKDFQHLEAVSISQVTAITHTKKWMCS